MSDLNQPAAGAHLCRLMQQAVASTQRLIAAGLAAQPRPASGAAARRRALVPPAPGIRFDLRGRSAGQFRIDSQGRCTIRYNPTLLLRYGEEFLRSTVPHEVAHYLAYRLHGRQIRPHGPEWQALMHTLGADPSRCHDYDVSDLHARRLRYYTYRCGCSEHRLSSIRHNKVQAGTRYLCRRCGETLQPGPEPEPAAHSATDPAVTLGSG